MSRYSFESAITVSGVFISRSRSVQNIIPADIRTAHSTPPEISVVYTAVFSSLYCFAPNSCETMTEQPMLQPNANAMKISVIS